MGIAPAHATKISRRKFRIFWGELEEEENIRLETSTVTQVCELGWVPFLVPRDDLLLSRLL